MNSITKVTSIALCFYVLTLTIPTPSHALIVLAPIILIPIVKLLAIIIAGLTLPATAIGVIYAKLTKHNVIKVVMIAIGILLIIAILFGIALKIINPDRPIL